ncbi:hypothetical protein MNBD_GAMMA09-2281 [hydrothermal vent metagenome]|uniref:PLD phosphodiesterase domain-containing protein n=1 Tax=hydrothermal vent metagenome TaxID=652676 RepID=A0A3B0XS78_9ZZZZ
MTLKDLEKILTESLQDFKLDQSEKIKFKELSETLTDDQVGFIKNRAFDLSRPFVEQGGELAVRVHNWLERVIKAIQPVQSGVQIKSSAYFSPGKDCRNNIIRLIKGAKKTVSICVFTISDNKITQAIMDAHNRGIDVSIISDNDKANDRGSDIYQLMDKGLNVILDDSPYHMHHKFMLVDSRVLLSGSFNWTRSASDVNQENILISYDDDLVSLFNQNFEKLKRSFKA